MGRWTAWATACLLGLGWVGCEGGGQEPVLPAGHWVYGSAPALAPVLDVFGSMSGTPVARFAGSLRERLADCEQFLAHGEVGESWSQFLTDVHCVDADEVPASIADLRDRAAAGFVLTVAGTRRLRGRLELAESGALEIVAALDRDEDPGVAALLVGGDEPPGPAVLDSRNTLVHARVRPAAGLNLAALVSPESQADRMFRLRSALFTGTLLEGTWEMAVYLPREHRVTPPMALALDHSLRAAATTTMKSFVAELEDTWPVHHSAMHIAGEPGTCFLDLELLPDLAPCYVVTERSIVFGWNVESIELALAAASDHSARTARDPLADRGGLVVHLDRFPEADRRLQQKLGVAAKRTGPLEGWDALRLEGVRQGAQVALRLSLEDNGAP